MILPQQTEPRAGFTLIEMLVVIVFLISMTSGSLALLTKLRETEARSRNSIRMSQEVRRLSHDLRELSGQSVSVELMENPSRILLSRDGNKSELRSSNDGRWIEFVAHSRGDKRIVRRDRYWIGDNAKIIWHANEEPPEIAVEISHQTSSVFRIECSLDVASRKREEAIQ